MSAAKQLLAFLILIAGIPILIRGDAPESLDLWGLLLGLSFCAPLLTVLVRRTALAVGEAAAVECYVQGRLIDGESAQQMASPSHGMPLFLAGCGLGLILFVHQVGMAVVWPTAMDWINAGDRLQHQLGWDFYRRSSWSWPPGLTINFPYPVGTSVVYTDSIPLFAMPLKAMSSWLPTRFQYLGLVLLLAWCLQAGVGAILARILGLVPMAALFAAGLLALQPVLMSRIMHTSLTWHWLVISGMCLLLGKQQTGTKHLVWGWLLLCAAASLVHPYLAVMVLALLVVWAVSHRSDATIGQGASFRTLCAALGVTLLGWYLSGAFALRSVGALAGVELGEYSSNLLAPFDPGGTSRWFGSLPLAMSGQYEGRAYPGSGGWLIVIAASMLAWRYPAVRARLQTRSWFWLAALAVAAALFAIGPRPSLGYWTLFDISSWTPRALEIFHASGRFVWIPHYAVLAAALALLAMRPRQAPWMLGLALLLQAVELLPSERIGERLFREASTSLVDPSWVNALPGRRQLVLLPARLCGGPPIDDMQAARLALQYDLLINSAYLARYNGRALRADCARREHELTTGRWDTDTVYVLGEPLWSSLRKKIPPQVACDQHENFAVCAVTMSDAWK